jgi:Flp pilus assembly protein TadB
MSDSSEAVGKKSAARRAAVTTRLAGAGDAVGDQVARELVRLSLRQVPAALFASFICAGLVAYVTWDSVPYVPLLAWVALLGAASLARLWLWARASGRPEGRGLRAAFVAGSAIGGALWGAGASFIILVSCPL